MPCKTLKICQTGFSNKTLIWTFILTLVAAILPPIVAYCRLLLPVLRNCRKAFSSALACDHPFTATKWTGVASDEVPPFLSMVKTSPRRLNRKYKMNPGKNTIYLVPRTLEEPITVLKTYITVLNVGYSKD